MDCATVRGNRRRCSRSTIAAHVWPGGDKRKVVTDMRFTAAVTHEGDWYVARCPEVEVTSQGCSIEDSLANLREALELYLEDEPQVDVA